MAQGNNNNSGNGTRTVFGGSTNSHNNMTNGNNNRAGNGTGTVLGGSTNSHNNMTQGNNNSSENGNGTVLGGVAHGLNRLGGGSSNPSFAQWQQQLRYPPIRFFCIHAQCSLIGIVWVRNPTNGQQHIPFR